MSKETPLFFIGIKGTGMAALACMLHDMGYQVSGSDLEKHFFTETPLIERKIPIYSFNHHVIENHSIVIVGNAFLDDFSEVKQAKANKTLTIYRYHEFIGEFMKNYTSVCVAGSHGKTTTTGMMETMINYSLPCGYIVGDGSGYMPSDSTHFVLESCEFRRHFLAYHCQIGIITNIDLDHVDYFKDIDDYRLAYEQFALNCQSVIACGDDYQVRIANLGNDVAYYGFNGNNDAIISIINEDNNHTEFVINYQGNVMHFNLPLVGHHLILNATACILAGLKLNLSLDNIECGLAMFKGEKRRFVVEYYGDNVIVDDYAHHPTEISVTIDAAKKRFPGKKIVAIYKPHRASRVVHFKQQFIDALNKADVVYTCEFTSIDDQDDPSCTSITYLTNCINGASVLSEDNQGAVLLQSHQPCVYLFMSSKDIYHLEDLLKEKLNNA